MVTSILFLLAIVAGVDCMKKGNLVIPLPDDTTDPSHRLAEFTPKGDFVQYYDLQLLVKPTDVKIHPITGEVLVLNETGVFRVNSTGGVLGIYGEASGENTLGNNRMAFDTEGNLYVARTNPKLVDVFLEEPVVMKFDQNGKCLGPIFTLWRSNLISGIAVDSQQTVWVVTVSLKPYFTHIFRYTKSGDLFNYNISACDSGTSYYSYGGIAESNGHMYIGVSCAMKIDKVAKVDYQSKLISSFPLLGHGGQDLMDIQVDEEGNIYVFKQGDGAEAEMDSQIISVFDQRGNYLKEFGGANPITCPNKSPNFLCNPFYAMTFIK